MIGTIINAAGIGVGCLAGLTRRGQISPARQNLLKAGLVLGCYLTGGRLLWNHVNGSFGSCLAQVGVALLALILGRLLGRLLHLQKLSNRLGQLARARFERAGQPGFSRFNDGFLACAILYSVSPLAILGSLQDGLQGNWHLLALKSVMDGLAAVAFASAFGAGALLALVPVVAWQGFLTLGAQWLGHSWLAAPQLAASFHVTTGLFMFSVGLVILEVEKVELADYLPALAVAPLLARWWLV
jgi:uncharacterized membrane protein YqgA involved in biofilm formation